jgi:hypothetical protein
MVPLIDDATETWPLPQSEQSAFRAMSEEEPWSGMTAEEIERKIATELGQHPFGDVGRERSVAWSAFGVVWTICCVADKATWLAVLELAAAIQIVQVEFADVDLLIIPSSVSIDVGLADETEPQCIQLPDNGRLAWKVTMPKAIPDASSKDYQLHLMAVVLMVLGQTTALPVARLDELIETRMERGLPGRVFSVRPLRELMEFVQPDSPDFAKLGSEARPTLGADFRPIEATELRWRIGPGPGYSRALAEKYLQNRYQTTTRGLRLTLPRIVKDGGCRRMLLRLKAEGWLCY